MSRVDVRGEILLAGFIRDVTDRRAPQDEREALLREQAARAEAERVAEMVSGMQLLVDAALAHRTLDDMLTTSCRACAPCSTPTPPRSSWRRRATLTLAAASGGAAGEPRRRAACPFGEGFAGRVAAEREPCSSRTRRRTSCPTRPSRSSGSTR